MNSDLLSDRHRDYLGRVDLGRVFLIAYTPNVRNGRQIILIETADGRIIEPLLGSVADRAEALLVVAGEYTEFRPGE